MNLGEILRLVRWHKRLTQGDASKLLGITRQYYNRVEKMRAKAGRNVIVRMAKIFDIPYTYLIIDENDDSKCNRKLISMQEKFIKKKFEWENYNAIKGRND